MYTDFSGYEHLVEKELNHHSISLAECREWIATKKCEYGTLSKAASSGIWSTNNKVEVDYPNRFSSLFSPKRYYKENCVIIETKLYSHFNQSTPSNVLSDLSNCKYQDGSCQPGKINEIMVWDVNKDQNCQYISIGKLDGIMNNGLWINSQNQIALELKGNKMVRDCNLDLLISEEGFAVRKLVMNKLPIPQALTSSSVSQTPRSEDREREEYYKRQREIQKDRELREQQIRRDKEVRDKYEADRKEFERRREEKMKQHFEFEKRKQEKIERLARLKDQESNNNTSNNNNLQDNRTDRTKRSNKDEENLPVKRSQNITHEIQCPEFSRPKNVLRLYRVAMTPVPQSASINKFQNSVMRMITLAMSDAEKPEQDGFVDVPYQERPTCLQGGTRPSKRQPIRILRMCRLDERGRRLHTLCYGQSSNTKEYKDPTL
uniref:Ricin B-type lectin domain-containing protein n=1 Tax=Heterorhabditis bacteriophora TaxID=37862 RepID=A0A1I7WGG0_HETBA